MDFRSIQKSEVKIPARPSAENKTVRVYVSNFVKQFKSFDILRCLVQLSDPALQDLRFVNLSVVAAHFLLGIVV